MDLYPRVEGYKVTADELGQSADEQGAPSILTAMLPTWLSGLRGLATINGRPANSGIVLCAPPGAL
jgi:hypothetical protein